ncbi:uncharacterized protein LOC135398793 isoform X2 [Ornithodoros turicata]|uniref:uncharacterized protein LOC135398793 isoform X2 n=1 Tax=Ornithodoros turicata TaxID=34597 RepID=UPI00313888B8
MAVQRHSSSSDPRILKRSRVSYHSIPGKEKLQKLWLGAINKKTPYNVRTAKVCCKHFKEEDFLKNIKSGRRLLVADAVPSVMLPADGQTEPAVAESPSSSGEIVPNADEPCKKATASESEVTRCADKPRMRVIRLRSSEPVNKTCEDAQETVVHFEHVVPENNAKGQMESWECTSLALKYQVVCQSEAPVIAEQRHESSPEVPAEVELSCQEAPLQVEPDCLYGQPQTSSPEVPAEVELSCREAPLQIEPDCLYRQPETSSPEVPAEVELSCQEAPLQVRLDCMDSYELYEALSADIDLNRTNTERQGAGLKEMERELREAKEKVAILEEQRSMLQVRCRELEAQRSTFSIEHLKDNRADFQFYTGLPSYEVFKAILKYLNPGEKGSNIDFRISSNEPVDYDLLSLPSIENQCFLVLVRLKLGLLMRDLAYRFVLDESTVQRVFSAWISFMYQRLSALPLWGSRQAVSRKMPEDIAKKFPKFRAAVEVTEIGCSSSSGGTMKGLIAMSPDGLVSFVSPLFPGGTSDRDLVTESGFLELQFDAGDCVIARRSFYVADLLKPLKVRLCVPPKEKTTLMNQDVVDVQKVALERIRKRVEVIKSFHILDRQFPTDIAPMADRIWTVCCVLTNFQGRRL